MKVCKDLVCLDSNDIINYCESILGAEGISISDIEISDGILVSGNIKKGFKIKFTIKCNLFLNNINEICLELKEIKALKINLFSVVEKIVHDKCKKESVRNHIHIQGKQIFVRQSFFDNKLKGLKLNEIFLDNGEIKIRFENTYDEIYRFVRGNIVSVK